LSIARWLPPKWARTILPISRQSEENQYIPVGTGFLVSLEGTSCLITANHLVFDNGTPRPGPFVLNNLVAGGIRIRPCDASPTEPGLRWISHSSGDIAATIFPAQEGIDAVNYFSMPLFEDFANITEGEDIFYLGFPLGICGLPNRVPSRIELAQTQPDEHSS
jgi:hypothetical protein